MMTKSERFRIIEALKDINECVAEAMSHYDRVVSLIEEVDARERERDSRKHTRKRPAKS
jgi:hypothetical protein